MSWGKLNINAYKDADLALLFAVVDGNDDPYEFTGTNVINVYRRYETTALLSITLTWDGTYYTGAVAAADLDLLAIIYRLEWINSNATTRPIVTGNFTLSDVFTDTRATAEATLTVDTTTFQVTVSDSDVAATAAIAAKEAAETAQTAAELAQTGAETAETNAEGHETAASGFATDALGHANDAEAAADKALSRIKDKKQVTADYTLLVTDEGTMILAEHGVTKINITVPNELFTDFSDGYPVIAVRRKGLAEVEIISDGVSVIVGGAEIAEQNHTVSIDWEDASTVTITGGVS